MKNNRRNFLKNSLALGVSGAASGALAASGFCGINTPRQPLGPFFPIDGTLGQDADLTRKIQSDPREASGQKIYIGGMVQNEKCQPLVGALVEVWQASENGRYLHPADSDESRPIDPHFQYSGRAISGSDGDYLFKSIIPGPYRAGQNWVRPPHIHFKISKAGYHSLVTQMYFSHYEDLNQGDLILRDLSKDEQDSVIVTLETSSDGFDPEALSGTFNLKLIEK